MTAMLRRISSVHDTSRRTGMPVDEILDDAAPKEHAGRPPQISRRDVLAGAAAGGAALAISGVAGRLPHAAASTSARDAPRIVIIGAGGAGVRCAHALWDQGIRSQVYEGADRVGGRMWTLRNFFADGQIGEHGGGFVSSEHHHLRALVARFGLALEDVDGGSQPGGTDAWAIDGRRYTVAEIVDDWGHAHDAFHDAARRAPYPQKWNHHNDAGVALDHLSVPDWIDQNLPGGTGSRFGQLMLTNILSEYGGPPEETSALNLIALLGDAPRRSPFPIDGTDERWHVVGGNDLVVSHMVSELPAGTIETGVQLLAARDRSAGALGATVLTFQRGHHTFDVVADMVVFALPFKILRTLDLSRLTLSDRKRRAIDTQGLGTNLKLHVQVEGNPWLAAGRSGGAYSDPRGFQDTWDETVAQPGHHSVLLGYPGGAAGIPTSGAAHGVAPEADVARLLGQVEPIFPGVTAAYRGLAWRDAWALDPWHHGAYSYYRIGQYTDFGGYEKHREGNRFFCGEHTSVQFQGYMEGAIRSGELAASQIVSRLSPGLS
jgi:monoamine oxidase